MQNTSVSYEQLWQQVLQDDIQGLEQIYKNYYPALFAYARKLVEDHTLAEDAIQDTFIYVWNHRRSIGEIHSMQFYLTRAVRNTCLALIKKQSKFQALEEAEAKLKINIQTSELDLMTEDSGTKEKLKTALDELSNRQREIIFLKFFNNLDYQEISQVLNINYQSVVNHVHKAIQKLRQKDALRVLRILITCLFLSS
ncbi:MAG: sigma-70 family RNA polymerase sigma factor [Bacteroidota bacterium]